MYDTSKFPGAKVYWHNGKLENWQSSRVHVMSHALHYGSSVFEGIRAYETDRGPAIFRLEDHIDRLFRSARAIMMEVPYSRERIVEACRLVVRENRLTSAYVRPNLIFGYGNLGLTPKACPVELTVGCWEWGAYLGEKALKEGVHVLLLPQKRFHPTQINASVKLGGLYVQSNIFATEARRRGYDEAVFLNLEERISEGPGENIIIVKNKVLRTNDAGESVLEGLTRTTVLKLAADLGYQTEIAPITVEDFLTADEAFFTGTAAEVTPITRITDSRNRDAAPEEWPVAKLGNGKPGRISLQLARRYADVVRGRVADYEHWLTHVYDSAQSARKALNGGFNKSTERISHY